MEVMKHDVTYFKIQIRHFVIKKILIYSDLEYKGATRFSGPDDESSCSLSKVYMKIKKTLV